ncbi:MAG: non-ribosomal peptide synthetase [Candidatus Eiseniibacteriota bacterium]
MTARRAPLSLAQQRLWLLEQLEPESRAYHMRAAFRVHGEIDVHRLERSVAEIVRRHEPLRTTFASEGGEPVQVIHESVEHRILLDDLTGVNAADQETELQLRMTREVRRPFDLGEGPLLRVVLYRCDARKHVLLIVVHHLVADGWSMGLFARELVDLNAALSEGRPSPLRALPLTYSEHAARQRGEIESGALDEQLSWWTRQLAGAPASTDLPTDRPRPPSQGHRAGVVTGRIPAAEVAALDRLARAEGVTPFMVLLTAVALVVHRHTAATDVVLGTPIANRNWADVEELIGFFVNTLALRVDLARDPTFRELLARVRATAIDAFDRQDLPFERLVEELRPPRDPSRTPLFQVMLLVQNVPLPRLEGGGLRLEYLEVECGTARFDLSLFARREADELALLADYDADLFDEATIERLLARFRRVLDRACAEPDQRIGDLDLLGADERRLLDELNRTEAEYPEVTLADLFEAQAARTPEAPALVDGDERLTFAELNARANRLALRLRREGVAGGDVVAVRRERSAGAVIALLAAMKAGAAWLPVDPSFPAERVEFMLRDAKPRVVLGDDEEDSIGEPATNPPRTTTADDVAWVLYTSGSTGTPKGVLGLHRGAVNRIVWGWREHPFRPGEVACHKTPLGFVDSVQEVLGPLLAGVPVVVARDDTARDPRALVEAMARHSVSRLVVVPSLLRALLDLPGDLRAKLPALALVISSGERLTADLIDGFQRRLPGTRLVNLYGSSEVSADVTAWDAPARGGTGDALLGRPIANARIHVLDERGRSAPIGVPGEIVVGGAGLARGYLGRPELTAERFVADPFAGRPGERLYRTGDRGRIRADGNLEYLGRSDHQLKIRGVRIEPGETEAALLEHPAVREVVVGARERRSGDPDLVAWFVTDRDPAPVSEELRAFLAAKLPAFLVPSLFVRVADVPRTPSGKADRAKLTLPEAAAGPAAGDVPRTPFEQLLAEIWREEIGIAAVRTADNFYDVGGHSLLAVRVVEKLRERSGIRLPPRDLLLQTLGQVARRCEQRERERSARAPTLGRKLLGAARRLAGRGGGDA